MTEEKIDVKKLCSIINKTFSYTDSDADKTVRTGKEAGAGVELKQGLLNIFSITAADNSNFVLNTLQCLMEDAESWVMFTDIIRLNVSFSDIQNRTSDVLEAEIFSPNHNLSVKIKRIMGDQLLFVIYTLEKDNTLLSKIKDEAKGSTEQEGTGGIEAQSTEKLYSSDDMTVYTEQNVCLRQDILHREKKEHGFLKQKIKYTLWYHEENKTESDGKAYATGKMVPFAQVFSGFTE